MRSPWVRLQWMMHGAHGGCIGRRMKRRRGCAALSLTRMAGANPAMTKGTDHAERYLVKAFSFQERQGRADFGAAFPGTTGKEGCRVHSVIEPS